MKNYLYILFTVLMTACGHSTSSSTEEVESAELATPEQELIARVQAAHGVDNLEGKEVSFTFRDKQYVRDVFNNAYGYSRSGLNENGEMVIDSWRGDDFERTVNGVTVQVTEKDANAFKNSINSVFYFALLPASLTDPAVNVELLEETKIKGIEYAKIKVTFDEEGGGEDHHDIFIYWFNKETNTMDYLAYEYFTNGGGIRFREAYNPRTVGGFRVQDYSNFEPPSGVELIDMDKVFEMGRMELVSDIVLTDANIN